MLTNDVVTQQTMFTDVLPVLGFVDLYGHRTLKSSLFRYTCK